MNGWSAKDVTLGASGAQTISGIVTNQPISIEGWPITAGGALNMALKIKVSGVTKVGTITAKLQTAIGSDYVDSKTVAITTNGAVYIKLQTALAGDQTYLPLLNKGQVVITTTDAGDVLTITSVEVLQEL